MSRSKIQRLFELSRFTKQLLQVFADAFFIVLCLELALALRMESWASMAHPGALKALPLLVPLGVFVFYRLGFYQSIVRHFVGGNIRMLSLGVMIVSSALAAGNFALGFGLPRSVPVIFAVLLMSAIIASRFTVRGLYLAHANKERTRVVIYGAGKSGRQLLQSLQHASRYHPVGFVDQNPSLRGLRIGGLPVFGPDQIGAMVDKLDAEIILMAIPSATRNERAAILRDLEQYPVLVQSIPGVEDLVSGRAKVSDIREVDVLDLLGRDPVPPRQDLLDKDIRDQRVMVTGAGGSIGSELCRQILRQKPAALVLFELSELALYQIELELTEALAATTHAIEIVAVLGSVQNEEQLLNVMQQQQISTVYHAAAYKHVPLVELNPIEGIRNNVMGTSAVARAAARSGVSAFILISTDKAVRPTNVMGASKRLAELVCQALAREHGATRYSIVRFGNVLGSSGSVIPRFRDQIAQGGPVTVTDPEVTRYFMTIPEAALLVIQSGAMARSGDLFLLDMGQPVRILDLAKRMIRLSGFSPVVEGDPEDDANRVGAGQVRINFTGLRPGEKLYEELLLDGNGDPTDHPEIVRAREVDLPWERVSAALAELEGFCVSGDEAAIRRKLEELPLSYRPTQTHSGQPSMSPETV